MPPKTFYEIDKTSYLFGKPDSPEEKVRQWVVFELLSTYGFDIKDIQFEVQCKIGSKYFPADIVIYKDHNPIIVIECKRQEDKNQEEALKQAESYANYLKVIFLVFTNGQSWVVKRNVQGLWSTVSDIPSNRIANSQKTITDTLRFLEKVKPVLYWVYRTVPKENAYRYFSSLLYFFQSDVFGYEMLVEMNVRRNLIDVVEDILCLVGAGNINSVAIFDDDGYKMEKMKNAVASFETYLGNIGYPLIFTHRNYEGYRFQELLGMLQNVDDLIKSQKGMSNNESLLLRLISALKEYLWQVYEAKSYIEINSTLMRQIELFVNEALRLELNSELPDSLDVEDCNLMRIYSSEKQEAR